MGQMKRCEIRGCCTMEHHVRKISYGATRIHIRKACQCGALRKVNGKRAGAQLLENSELFLKLCEL